MSASASRRAAVTSFFVFATIRDPTASPALTPPGVTPIGVSEAQLPAAVVMMRAAELARLQETMLRSSASMTNADRFAQGIAVGRGQASMSVKQLLTNTQLARLPGCAAPASTLAGISRSVSRGDGPLTDAELLQIAAQYQLARQQILAALERLPDVQRRDAEVAEANLRAADDEAKRPYWSEGGRFSSGRMGACNGATQMGICNSAEGKELDEATRRERDEYLRTTMDDARAQLKEQRLRRSAAKAGEELYKK